MQQDVRVVQLADHFFSVGNEVRRKITAIELHAFDDFQFGGQALGLFNRDDAFIADPLHRFSDIATDFGVTVRRDAANLGDLVGATDLLRTLDDVLNDSCDRKVDAALEIHRVHAGSNCLGTFTNDRLGEYGRRRRAVTGDVIGLGSNFLDHLSAHVLELVFKLDFLGNRNTILGDTRCAKGFVDDDVAALGTQRYLDGIGQRVDALEHLVTGLC